MLCTIHTCSNTMIQPCCTSSSTEKPRRPARASRPSPPPTPAKFLDLDHLFSQNRRRQFRPVCKSNSGKLLPSVFSKKSFAWHKYGIHLQVAEFAKSPCYRSMHQLLSSLEDTDRHLADCQKVQAFQSIGIRHVSVEE